MNSAACCSKTGRSPAGSPCCEKLRRGKGLMQGHRASYRRAHETSRNIT